MGGSSIIKTLFYLLLFSSLASRSRSEPRVLPFFLLFDRELSWITRDPDRHPVEFFATVQTKLTCPALNGRPTCPADEIAFRVDVNKWSTYLLGTKRRYFWELFVELSIVFSAAVCNAFFRGFFVMLHWTRWLCRLFFLAAFLPDYYSYCVYSKVHWREVVWFGHMWLQI